MEKRSAKTIKVNAGLWSVQEENDFDRLCRLHGNDWKKISEELGTRSEDACRSHGKKIIEKMKSTDSPVDRELKEKLT